MFSQRTNHQPALILTTKLVMAAPPTPSKWTHTYLCSKLQPLPFASEWVSPKIVANQLQFLQGGAHVCKLSGKNFLADATFTLEKSVQCPIIPQMSFHWVTLSIQTFCLKKLNNQTFMSCENADVLINVMASRMHTQDVVSWICVRIDAECSTTRSTKDFALFETSPQHFNKLFSPISSTNNNS